MLLYRHFPFLATQTLCYATPTDNRFLSTMSLDLSCRNVWLLGYKIIALELLECAALFFFFNDPHTAEYKDANRPQAQPPDQDGTQLVAPPPAL